MNLKLALSLILLGLVLSVGSLAILLSRMTDSLDSHAKTLRLTSESIWVAEELQNTLLIYNREALLHLHSPEKRSNRPPAKYKEKVFELVKSAELFATNAEERMILAQIQRQAKIYFESLDGVLNSKLSDTQKYNQALYFLDTVQEALSRFVEINVAQARETHQTVEKENATADQLAIGISLLTLFIIVVIAVGSILGIYKPLMRLRGTIARYGSGDSSARASREGAREIGEIAETFNVMAEQLADKQDNQLRFIASIAHDLRNPLSSISLGVEVLNADPDSPRKPIIQIIERQTKSLERLVGDLMDNALIESGKLSLQRADEDIRPLVLECLDLFQRSSPLHRFTVELPSESESLFCWCDKYRIIQVLNNLLSNAVKYSPSGGMIFVKAFAKDSLVYVTVADEGIGIAQEELDKIFQPFRRSSTTGRIPGIGLGLSICKRIVEAHGGTLSVKSRPNKGSTFEFSLQASVVKEKGLATLRPGHLKAAEGESRMGFH